MGYTFPMIEIRETDVFAEWLDNLRDIRARARILVRIERLAAGNPGHVEPVAEGVAELKIDYGPGYRVYFKKRGRELVFSVGRWRQKHSRQRYQTRAAPRSQPVGVRP